MRKTSVDREKLFENRDFPLKYSTFPFAGCKFWYIFASEFKKEHISIDKYIRKDIRYEQDEITADADGDSCGIIHIYEL